LLSAPAALAVWVESSVLSVLVSEGQEASSWSFTGGESASDPSSFEQAYCAGLRGHLGNPTAHVT
jgi:hypothetical protein